MRSVHVVVPDSVDDPARPSGGNTYDRRVCAELRTLGWEVDLHAVPGEWPRPEAWAWVALAATLSALPDGSIVLLDGLVSSCSPEVVVPESSRLRLVVLVHLPLGAAQEDIAAAHVRDGEGRALSCATAVLTTSGWTRRWLLNQYVLDPTRVHVAEPGVDHAEAAQMTREGREIVCVATVLPAKGHDQLLAALEQVRDLEWRCTCAGALDVDPPFTARLVRRVQSGGLADRVRFTGALARDELASLYAAADLLVLTSRLETYGLVVTEALARGLPVLVTAVGGVPDALGRAPDGARPGLLVPAGDIEQIAGALRSWLTDSELRGRLRASAQQRRLTLAPWSATARTISEVLQELVA